MEKYSSAIDLTNQWNNLIIKKDIDGLLELVTDDYERSTVDRIMNGKKELREYLEQFFTNYDVVDIVNENKVFIPGPHEITISGIWEAKTNDRILIGKWTDTRVKKGGRWLINKATIDF